MFALMPLEMNVVAPLMIQLSPSRLARVAIADSSEPVPGWVMASARIVSPDATPGN
jgi:hypothetical protein